MLESGIQTPDGGVARYRLADEGRNLPVSTEITGYAASTFAYLYRRTGEARYLDAGVRACRFLTRVAWNAELGTFPFECAAGSPGYFFDCGIIVRGLLAVWRLTGENELLEIAVTCGESMIRDYLTDTAIHPIISLPERRAWPYERRWSREPGCFQLKSALAWRDLGVETQGPHFRQAWSQALQFALANDPVFLPGAAECEKVMDRLHAYCYYVEALLAEPAHAAALAEAIERASAYLRDLAPRFARSDVYGQLLRIRLFADVLGLVPLNATQAAEEAAAIPGFQFASPDPALDGGFCFGRKGDLLPYVNPVSTAFCAQALDLWRLHPAGEFRPALDELI